MTDRTRIARRHRRTLVVAMGVSVAVHAAVLAFVRLGVPTLPDTERARTASDAVDRYGQQRPIQVVRLAPPATARERQTGAYPETSAARDPAETDAAASPRLTLAAGGPDLRPAEATSEGFEHVVPTVSAVAGADGAATDLNEGVAFEPASRAARDAARDRGRDRRGSRGSGIGITILGPGGGDCDPSLLPGGGLPVPTGIVDDFAGGLGGATSGGGRSAPGSLIAGAHRIGGGSVSRCGEGRIRIGGGGGVRTGGRPGC